MIETLLHYNINAPRYTSYPPANLFRKAENELEVEELWKASNSLNPSNLSFYFHIPFCSKRCLFCGCTSETIKEDSYREEYMNSISLEMEKKLPWIDSSRKVTQVHFGGGTPTSVPVSELKSILDRLKERFTFSSRAEIAIECNPASVTETLLSDLALAGFNRISYGIQDFNLETLRLIGRDPSLIDVPSLVSLSHKLGFQSVNLDLIYGLPGQTLESFSDSVSKAIAANPDRIALFSYAHVPWKRPEQKRLEEYHIPDAYHKMSFFLKARDMFKEAGYQNIGMDHFVKSSDSLFFASEQGLLHRNFQGYCTRSTTGQVYAFGSSAISQLDNAYLQNTHITSDYMEKVKRQEMTEVRVHPLTENEKIWRNMIERLMCNNALKINEIEKKALGERWNRLCALEKEGLLTKINDDEIRTTTLGSLVIRYLVSVIDPLLENQESEGVFSKTI